MVAYSEADPANTLVTHGKLCGFNGRIMVQGNHGGMPEMPDATE